jgi:hypothetical protein
MRSFKYMMGMFLLVCILAISCSEDFLETKPLTEISEVDLWGDPSLARLYINHIYAGIPEPFTRGRLSSNLVDEADYRGNTGSKNFNNCIINQDATPTWNSIYYNLTWSNFYSNIRYCNSFLENVDRIPFDDVALSGLTEKDKMTGEVHFMRAYLYHHLLCMFGGVPIVKEPYGLDDDFNAPRDSYEDCIDFIVEECDLAAGLLPEAHSGVDLGRATKGAAMALKARVLLYAASDLHNTNVSAGFSNPELLGYVGGDRTSRWTAAKNAAKDVMNLNLYSLYMANPAPDDSIAQNYAEYFLNKSFTEEDIWAKSFVVQSSQMIGLYSGPNGYHGWGANAPVGDLVDDFEMADGTRFDWNNPSHSAEPYINRDQRFYATIFYEGAKWRQRPGDVADRDPLNAIQVGTWEKWDNASQSMVQVFGLDTRKGGVEEWNGSYTGYYMRKFLDPALDISFIEAGGGGYQSIPYRFFRYAEILLNYAEACIELGEDGEARTYINMVRRRAGQPDITESGEALRIRYRNERRIELCFEEHRINDVRRWVIGPEAYHPVTTAVVVYKLLPDNTTATIPTITHEVFQDRSWLDKGYFMPISRSEMNKNNQLIQNPGY